MQGQRPVTCDERLRQGCPGNRCAATHLLTVFVNIRGCHAVALGNALGWRLAKAPRRAGGGRRGARNPTAPPADRNVQCG